MNYQLAKELKESGYQVLSHGDDGRGCFGDVCVPTLSELIADCGFKWSGFGSLKIDDGIWTASTPVEKDEGRHFVFSQTGSTPEEAVARLWIALNKKV